MKKLFHLLVLVLLTVQLPAMSSTVVDSCKIGPADLQIFADATCSKLKNGVGPKEIEKIENLQLRQVATAMSNGTYDKTYRIASYPAFASPQALAGELKLGQGFSRYQNMTGIYLEEGKALIFVGATKGKKIKLLLPFWLRKPAEGIEPTKDPNGWGLHRKEIALNEGANIINVERAGNVYIDYFDKNPKSAPAITVHFVSGKVNGYFDSQTQTDADWNRLLDNAVSPIMDAKGKHIQVAYPVEWFKQYTYGKGIELMNNYDKMLHCQYKLMGLVKYNKIPQNKILARVNFNYYMFRDGDGVAYLGDKGTMNMVANPPVVISGDPCWGFCHEVGHVLQMIPQMTWGGMMEVSNNIFSMYTTTSLGNVSRLKEQGNYAKARKSIIESSPKISYLQDPDVFNRLVPFWQLHLYFSSKGYHDFYADVMEQMRIRPIAGFGNHSISNLFQFIEIACDVSKTDLTDFFEQWGFFYTGNIQLEDYGKYNFNITQQQVDKTKAYIAGKKYAKPASDITMTVE